MDVNKVSDDSVVVLGKWYAVVICKSWLRPLSDDMLFVRIQYE